MRPDFQGDAAARHLAEDFGQRFRVRADALLQLDLAGFIQHAIPAVTIPQIELWKLHPNIFIQRAQELNTLIADALGQEVQTNLYSREVGYSICNRLQGFGLAHEIDTQQRELPLTNYSFRPSTQGLRLLKLLGEYVPNLEHYYHG
jgi:hypothetical protein